MIKILFICHGNICRSPMAEYVMKKLVKDAGREAEFEIASAATSREEIGNPVYPPAQRELAKHGISCKGHAARQMTPADYDYYDYLVAMEPYNIRRCGCSCPSRARTRASTIPGIPGGSPRCTGRSRRVAGQCWKRCEEGYWLFANVVWMDRELSV